MIFFVSMLSFVQIIFESLPVSSSGHVALLKQWLQRSVDSSLLIADQYEQAITYVLHGPTIIILFLLLFPIWWDLILGRPMQFEALFEQQSRCRVWRLIFFGGIADGITFFAWWLDLIVPLSLTIGFMITAIFLYSTRFKLNGKEQFDMNFSYAFYLGLGQALSLSPGISRFATTFAVGRWRGYSNKISFVVSFLIQMPLLGAAFCKGLITLSKNSVVFKLFFSWQMIGLIVIASVISYYAFCLAYCLAMKNKLWCFSWYMIMIAMLSLFV
ncbi:undecaprenyl-diphosphate phosphatase [Candidatus Dependentiae bacterium]|nr:undecaprenyl-diphosphate phosphatase [Candidatus Dependentiae bacterium]